MGERVALIAAFVAWLALVVFLFVWFIERRRIVRFLRSEIDRRRRR